MPNPVEGFFEVYEDMVEVLLVLEIFLTQNAQVEELLCGTPSCSGACLFKQAVVNTKYTTHV